MENKSKLDLTFVATQDMIDELSKRYNALVLAGIIFTTEDKYLITRHHFGHRYVCLGMLDNLKSIVNDVENEQLRRAGDGN